MRHQPLDCGCLHFHFIAQDVIFQFHCADRGHHARVIDLRARGISEDQARELRAQLAAFAEEWDSPEMSVYDNYEAHV